MFTFRTALIINNNTENTTRNKKLVLFHTAGQCLLDRMASAWAAFAVVLGKEATLRVSLKTMEAESTGERKLLLNRNKFVHAEPSREKSCCRSKRLEMEIQ